MADYNREIFFTKAVRAKPTTFTSADGVVAKEIFAPADPASRVKAIAISTDETVINYVQLRLKNLTTSEVAILGLIPVPAGSATTIGPQIVSGLNRTNIPWIEIDSDGNPFLDLNYNMNLEIKMLNAIAAGKTLSVFVNGGDYTE